MKKRNQIKDIFDNLIVQLLHRNSSIKYGGEAWVSLDVMKRNVDHDLDLFAGEFEQELLNEET